MNGGTTAAPSYFNSIGALPTKNWSSGYFETAENISGEAIKNTILLRRQDAMHVPVRCKRIGWS